MQLDWTTPDEIKDKEVRECQLIGDKHKTSAGEGVVCLQKRLAYDLEPMALAAGQHGETVGEPMLIYRRKAAYLNNIV